jgi:hypothetical protein
LVCAVGDFGSEDGADLGGEGDALGQRWHGWQGSGGKGGGGCRGCGGFRMSGAGMMPGCDCYRF